MMKRTLCAAATAMALTTPFASVATAQVQDDPTMGLSTVRPFLGLCKTKESNSAGTQIYAIFGPSEFDRHVKTSPNGRPLHEVHPTGMRTFFPAHVIKQFIRSFEQAAQSEHRDKTLQQMRSALAAVKDNGGRTANLSLCK